MILAKKSVLVDVIIPQTNTKIAGLVKDIALVVSFSILTALFAQLKVEIGAVPITMQTLAVLLAGLLLGSKRGALSQISYLFLGLTVIPWFARGGGIIYVFSPTFGYLIGFVAAAFFVGKLAEMGWDRKIKTAILAIILGNFVIYLFGLLWLANFIPLKGLLAVGLYPFLIGDLLKILLAGLILPTAWKLIKRSNN